MNPIPQGYKQTEIGVIPEDWEVCALGSIGNFKNGINKSAEDFGFGSPFVNLMDVFGKPEITGSEIFGLINSSEVDKKEYSLLEGDVLFIRSSVKPSGVGLTTVVCSDLNNTVYSGFLIRFRSDDSLYTYFKKYCFYEQSFRNRVISGSTVSANTNINQDVLKEILLAFPASKTEQTAIATALSDVDALITGLESLITKKQAIKTATMQQLLTGKTRLPQFAHHPNGTPKGTQQTELGEIPEDWDVQLLGSNVDFIGSGKTDTKGMGNYNLYGSTGLIGSCARAEYQGEAILIARVGANAGTLNFVSGHYGVSDNTLIVKVSKKNNINYFRYWLLRKNLNSMVFGSGQPLITGGQLKNVLLPVPDYSEQSAIAQILSDMDEEIQTLQTRLSKTQQIKQGMMQQLLTGKVRLI